MKFEKISLHEAENNLFLYFSGTEEFTRAYNEVELPSRATAGSAGYDFRCVKDICIHAGETVILPTFVRAKIDPGYVLLIFPRSSLGFKYKLTLDNTVGVIDSDYYNADNEGHIMVKVTNHSDKDLQLNFNDKLCQGVFVQFGTVEGEDNEKFKERRGGFGSTGR